MNPEIKAIQDKLEVILSILTKTKEFHNFSKHFSDVSNPKYDILLNDQKMEGYISFIEYTFYRNTIIELNNLFSSSKDEKFSLVKLLKDFSPGNYNAKYNPNQEFINKYIEYIEDNQKVITNIKTLRDKYYAHHDNYKHPAELYVVSHREIDNLLRLADAILEYFYLFLLNASLDTTPPYTYGEPIGLLNLIAIGRTKKMQDDIDTHFHNKR